nr:MAG TPA: hypothetical protein [Caudoviricetes sp.]DAM31753.1 MAG TPA: hypothetical protein [Caudoviricetes sp.]
MIAKVNYHPIAIIPPKSFVIPLVRTAQRNRTLFHIVKLTRGIFYEPISNPI